MENEAVLKNMELVSGLIVNFDKCSIFGVSVEMVVLRDMAEILGCGVGSLTYLDIKVGMNHRNVEERNCVVQKIKNRLRRWEDNKVSLGGRITLLNVVLSSLPTYYLSFYCIPRKSLCEIVKLQPNFFLGDEESN